MVLDRLAAFAVDKKESTPSIFARGGRVVLGVVVLGNVVGLCANVAASVIRKERGDLHGAAAIAFANNQTAAGKKFNQLALQKASDANQAASVQQFCEVVVLLIIIGAFTAVGIASVRRVRSALRDLASVQKRALASALGKQLQQRITGTTTFVFLTFLVRAAFDIMKALADAQQNVSDTCAATASGPCDAACYNVWTLLGTWQFFTPEFQLSIMLISAPLSMLVALWGMTDGRTLSLMFPQHSSSSSSSSSSSNSSSSNSSSSSSNINFSKSVEIHSLVVSRGDGL
jgi:hypothetical protein